MHARFARNKFTRDTQCCLNRGLLGADIGFNPPVWIQELLAKHATRDIALDHSDSVAKYIAVQISKQKARKKMKNGK